MRVECRGLPGYHVDDNGEVWGPRRKLSQWKDERGCMRVKAAGRPYAVHLLVLNTFVGPKPNGAVPRWQNGNQSDNRLVNLKWHIEGDPVRVERCRVGHEYTPENTLKWGTGHRICLACRAGKPSIDELPEVL